MTYLFSRLAPIYLTTPTTGVVNLNSLNGTFCDLATIDPAYEKALKDFMAANVTDDDYDPEMYDYSPDTLLYGDWLKTQADGVWIADPALPKHGFAAIHNVNEHTVQVLRSKWISKGAPASPCYPGQVDLETAGDYMGFDLPVEMYSNRRNANAIVEYVSVEEEES